MPYCEMCNRVVVMGTTGDGKKITLDPKARVYRIVDTDGENNLIERNTSVMVAHYFTCPQADKFKPVQRDHKAASAGE